MREPGPAAPESEPRGAGAEGPRANGPQAAFDLACRYLTTRERCAAQVRAYLARRAFAADEIDAAIRLLQEKRFVDDLRYARQYGAVRSRRSPRSGAWLMRELMQDGIDRETADRAVSEFLARVPEEDLARRVLSRLAGGASRGLTGPEWNDLRSRAAQRLRSRGFRPSFALRWIAEIREEPGSEDMQE